MNLNRFLPAALDNVRLKITLLLLLFAAAPGLGMFASVALNESAFRATGLQRAADAAVQINEVIDRNFHQRYADVQAFALNRAAQTKAYWQSPDYPNPLTDAMNAYTRVYGIYPLMVLVSPTGEVLAVNSGDVAGKAIDTVWLYDKSFSDAPWLKKVLAGDFLVGRNGLTGTVVDAPARSPEVARLTGGDGFCVVFAAPVRDKDGNILAVWANFATFDLVDEIVAGAYGYLASGNLRGTAITLLDAEGRVLANRKPAAGTAGSPRDFAVIGRQDLVAQSVPAARLAVAGERGAQVWNDAETGVPEAVGYARSTGAADYPGLGWSVLVRVPTAEVFTTLNTIELEMLIAGVLVALLATGGGALVGGLAARPIQRLTQAMTRLAAGDHGVDVPAVGRRDELGDMARAVEVFKRNAIEIGLIEAAQKKRDRQAEADKRQLLARLADRLEASVKEVVGRVSSASGAMRTAATSMADTAEGTSALSGTVAVATEEACANAQTAAAAVHELSLSTAGIARKIITSNEAARKAMEANTRSRETIAGLAAAANKIDQVVGFIERIAHQTNMLALNATIEAATAGEAGRGFAVVATEVKSLSLRIAEATGQIARLLGSVQEQSQSAVEASKAVGGTIEDINAIADDIAAAICQQEEATREIDRNVQQAAVGTTQVSGHIAEVREAAGKTGSAAAEVLGSSEELAHQARRLRDEVDQFLASVREA
jgi:methyl-accepting chemotaxis protein